MENEDLLRSERKYFSGLGFRYFVVSLVFLFGQVGAIFLVRQLNRDLLERYYIVIGMIPMYILLIPVLWGLFRNVKYTPIQRKKFTAGQLISAFFISYAFMYIGSIVGTVLNMVICGLTNQTATNALQELLDSSSMPQTILVVVICAPIVEEFIFRKILIDRLRKYGDVLAIVISALMFGLYHGNITQFVYATLIGLVFGYVYARSGNIKYSIGLHMVINFFGSVVSQFVMDKSGYAQMATDMAENPDNSLGIIMQNIGGMALIFLWGIIIFAFMITGIILFFVNKSKLTFDSGEVELQRGKRFSTIVFNPGVILFLIFWIAMFVVNFMEG